MVNNDVQEASNTPLKEVDVSVAEDVREDAEKEFKPFQVIPGGKGPEEPESPYWLRNIPEGAMFHTCQRGQTAAMFAQVLQHFDKTTVCYDLLNQVKFNVHTARFSDRHEKLQVIPIIPKEEGFDPNVPEEQEDGKSD